MSQSQPATVSATVFPRLFSRTRLSSTRRLSSRTACSESLPYRWVVTTEECPRSCCNASSDPPCSNHRHANVCRIWCAWNRGTSESFRTIRAKCPDREEYDTSRPTLPRSSARSSGGSGSRLTRRDCPLFCVNGRWSPRHSAFKDDGKVVESAGPVQHGPVPALRCLPDRQV